VTSEQRQSIRPGDPWRRLENMPATAPLWEKYRAYDAARTALEQAEAKQRRYLAEQRQIAARLAAAEADPDTADMEQYNRDESRQRLLARAIERSQAEIAQLKVRASEVEHEWYQTWENYESLRLKVSARPAASWVGQLAYHMTGERKSGQPRIDYLEGVIDHTTYMRQERALEQARYASEDG
jgi:hypothetical protein